MEATDTALLQLAASRASRRPGFMAHDLVLFGELSKEDPAEWLSAASDQLDRLALCRTPRRGAHFSHDVLAIAAHVQVEPIRLASLVRLGEVLAEFRGHLVVDDRQTDAPVVLAAARDETDEHTVLEERGAAGPGLPGWLHDAVERFWAEAPTGPSFPRDLDFAVLAGLPLAVVELPRLSTRAIEKWFGTHKLDLGLRRSEARRLRACLVALGGVGLIFVDAGDDRTQRRVSLAHEAGHFIVEYLLPRQEVAQRRPDLLPVVDGERPPTARERLSAVLGDVPIGVHTHLLDRGADGSASSRVSTAEWRARRVALELLAPQEAVRARMGDKKAATVKSVRTLLVEQFGLPVSLAADYADQLVTASAPPRLGLLDVLDRRKEHPQGSPGRPRPLEGPGRSSRPGKEEGT